MGIVDNDSSARRTRRSLILAGGGIKVAFQAGVLQVWLDEAGLTFDHADGASGGVFNLAMYCQGMSGTRIADNWRNVPPWIGIDVNWRQYAKFLYADSLFTLDRYRKNVFPRWGLDWDTIRSSKREATFNVYNFTQHRLEVLTPDQMTEDYLVACVSLPMWFPPVTIGEDIYIDPVFITDANLEEAIRRGADELWVIWTVSERSEWHAGFIAQYFQIIEASANGRFRQIEQRIDKNNAAVDAGHPGEFGRRIDLKILRAEVPLHYLVNFSSERAAAAVNRGVEAAREWCRTHGIDFRPAHTPPPVDATTVRFTETMKGFIAFGKSDPCQVKKNGKGRTALAVTLTIAINGVHRFITDVAHEGRVTGYVDCEALGGRLPVEEGTFNLFTDAGDPTAKQMRYRLHFRDSVGHPLTLSGRKDIKDDTEFDVWGDTTTLRLSILRGRVGPDAEPEADVVAAGIITIHLADFLRQLTTFRASGPNARARAQALARFGAFFLGSLWDVYAREVLTSAPF